MTASSKMSRGDMHAVLQRHGAKRRVQTCGINPNDLDLLYTLLDADGTDEVKILTFIRACQRLTGTARARDLTRLHSDVFRHLDWVERNDVEVANMNLAIGRILDTCDTINLDVFVAESDQKDPVLVASRAAARYHKSDILCKSPTAKMREPTPAPSRHSSKCSFVAGGGGALRNRLSLRGDGAAHGGGRCLPLTDTSSTRRTRLRKLDSNPHRLFLTRSEMTSTAEPVERRRQELGDCLSLDDLRQPDPPPLPPGLVDSNAMVIAETKKR